MSFSHIHDGRLRRYLCETGGTSLDTAGQMIDRTEAVLAASEYITQRQRDAIAKACHALGQKQARDVKAWLQVTLSNRAG